jgi:hypothetical protein
MVDKSNFTPDEWKLLLESVMAAGTAGDPSSIAAPLDNQSGAAICA